MDHIMLVEPSESYTDEIWRIRQEVMNSDDHDKFAGCGNLKDCSSAQEWIDTVRLWIRTGMCSVGQVPCSIYIAVRQEGKRIVGVLSLRQHINNPILNVWGGHIGYSVRPTERRKGYAKEMLKLALIKAKEYGISKVLITCDVDNIGSEKAILANGGSFEKVIVVDDCPIKRYWIEL